MLRFFDSAYISRLVVLFILAILFWIPTIVLHYPPVQPNYFSPLYSLYLWLFAPHLRIHSLVSLVLVVLTALLVNSISTEYGFTKKTSYRTAFIYLLFSAGLPEFTRLNPMSFINLLLGLYILLIMRVSTVKNPVRLSINGGLLIGLMSLFYLPALWLLVAQVVALRISRITKVNVYVASFMSFLLPFFYLFAYDYLTGNRVAYQPLIHWHWFRLKPLLPFPRDAVSDVVIGVFVVMVLIGLFRAYANLFRQKISKRRNMMTLMYLLLILFFVIVFCSETYLPVMLLLVPGSIVMSNFLRYLKRIKLAEVVFVIVFVLVLFNQYFQLYYAS